MRCFTTSFLLFKKKEHFKLFFDYFNSCHENTKFRNKPTANYIFLILKLQGIEISLSLKFTVNCFIRTCCNISLGSTLIFRCYQTRSTLQKPIRDVLLFANLKVIFRMKNRLISKLTFKGKIFKKCILLFCYKFW